MTDDQTLTGGFGAADLPTPGQQDLTLTGGIGAAPAQPAPAAPSPSPLPQIAQTLTGGAQIGVASAEWKTGELVDGRYEVLGEIGRGGMGVVYRVRHREWKIEMAVKTPLARLVQDAASKARFLREAQTWVDLGMHPNIVQCWYVRELGGLPRVFVDFLSGGDLKAWFKQGKVGPGLWDTIMDLVVQACDGLGYSHDSGLVHRDVKPGNMLMSADGRLCVTDFGLVKVAGQAEIEAPLPQQAPAAMPAPTDEGGLTLTGSWMGTPEYGAPEQWGGARRVDARADVYALGIVLFELCCGRRPFDDGVNREPPQVLVGRHLTQAPPDPRSFRPDVPEPLAKLVLACLAKDPEKRVPSMDHMRDALADAYQSVVGKRYPRSKPKPAEARADGLNNRAVSMWDLGQPEEAYAAWREALSLDAQHPAALYNQGMMRWYSGQSTDLDLCQTLRTAQKTHPRAAFYLGQVLLEAQDAQSAEDALQEALKDPAIEQDGLAWRAMGHAHMALYKFDEAKKAYDRALELMPGDEASAQARELAEAGMCEREGLQLFLDRSCIRALEGRVGTVNALALSREGTHAFADHGTENLSCWDLSTGLVERSYHGHARLVTSVALSPDGLQVLTGSEDSTIRLWTVATGMAQIDFYGKGHIGSVDALEISPDGKTAVSGGADRSVRYWELEKGTLVHTWWGHEKGVTAVVVMPNGPFVYSSGDEGSIRRWQVGSNEAVGGFETGMSSLKDMVLMPPSPQQGTPGALLVGGGDGVVRLLDLNTGSVLRDFVGHRGTVNAVAASRDGTFLLSGGDDRTFRIWDVKSGRCLRTFTGADGPIVKLSLSRDGRMALSGAKENIGHPLRVWDLGPPLDCQAPMFRGALAISRAQNLQESQEKKEQFEELLEAAREILGQRDASAAYLALQEARAVPGFELDPQAINFCAQLAARLPRKRVAGCYEQGSWDAEHPDGITRLAVMPSGNYAVSLGKQDKVPRLWDVTSGTCLATLEGHKQWVEALAVSADGRSIVTGAADCAVRIWSASDGKCLHELSGHSAEIFAVAAGSDGRLAFSSANDREIRAWELATGKNVKVLEGLEEPAVALAVMPGGGMVVSGNQDGTMSLWSLRSGKVLKSFAGHEVGITGLAISPDGRSIVSTGEDRALRVWNPDTGRCEKELMEEGVRMHALALCVEGRFALTSSREGSDGTVRLWDLRAGTCVQSLAEHAGGVMALSAASDGLAMVSGGQDKRMRVWTLDWELVPKSDATFSIQTIRSIRMAKEIPPAAPPAAKPSAVRAPAVPPPPRPPAPPAPGNRTPPRPKSPGPRKTPPKKDPFAF